ncbi:MAG: HEAT repeat domain-containing protein [Armatimonadota bacterium]
MDDELWGDEELDEDLPSWADHSPTAWQQRLNDPRSTDELIELALSDNVDGYMEALQILQIRGTREVLDAARGLCASPVTEERKLGVSILGRLGDTAPVLRVARRLRMSGEEKYREYADELANSVPGAKDIIPFPKEALATLLPMLETEQDIDTLRDVLCSIAEYGDYHPSIIPRIAEMRHHPCPEVRFTVTTRLAIHMDNPVARRALAELANDEDDTVRDLAREWAEMRRALNREACEEGLPQDPDED